LLTAAVALTRGGNTDEEAFFFGVVFSVLILLPAAVYLLADWGLRKISRVLSFNSVLSAIAGCVEAVALIVVSFHLMSGEAKGPAAIGVSIVALLWLQRAASLMTHRSLENPQTK
jgi:hypothetical protein